MRKVAITLLVICLSLSCVVPIYAKHQLNKEARAAQKRNRARQKAMKKDVKSKQKAAKSVNAKHSPL